MSRVQPLSGYPEWSPQEQVVESHIIATLQRAFSLHGYGQITTRAVEPVARLAGDSDAAKEIYTLGRLTADAEADAKLGLHFDLTVPFARYVEERQGQLHFPFKRHQVQKVWRGERPQEGRFREFYQADIDVVGRDVLPAHLEVEVGVVMARALADLPMPQVRFHLNNRRLVEGFYRGVGVIDVAAALRSVDKLDKIGPDGVRAELTSQDVPETAADAILALAQIRAEDLGLVQAIDDLWETSVRIEDPSGAQLQLAEGIAALTAVVDGMNAAVPGSAVADLRIARGLDYYTGTVYEAFVDGHEDLGSICSGGRYDSLVAGGGFPGVGLSVGVTRLVSRLLGAGLLTATRSVPTAVLVAVVDEEARPASAGIADRLRQRGIPAEVSPTAAKFGKQIQYADRRGIPFVWFPGDGDGEVKDIRSGEQVAADADAWAPPADDLHPRVVTG